MTVLFVCTGNTCRSPMAAALFKRLIRERGRADIRVESAGLAADGSPATAQAAAVMAEWGEDLSGHRSQQVTAELLEEADVICVMTPSHRQFLTGIGLPAEKITVPVPPIPDPFGGDEDEYRRTRDALQKAAEALLDKLPEATIKSGCTVRPMKAGDAPALAGIEAACFSHPWTQEGLREETDNPAACFLVAEKDGAPAGYAGMHIGGEEGFLANVAVDPACRRFGIASALLEALIAEGRVRGLTRLTLEVRPSNRAAVALYEKKGFQKDGVRPGFYRDPAEDAAIYSYYY